MNFSFLKVGAPATSRRVLIARFLAIVISLHAPSWLVAWVLQASRSEEWPLFNLDLLFAAAIACFSSLAGGVLLVLAWTADFVRFAAKNYHFMSVLDFVDAARFADMLNVRTFLSASVLVLVLVVAAVLVVCAWVVIRQTQQSQRLAVPLLALAMLPVGFDVANGSFHVFGLSKDSRIVNLNLAGSPVWNMGIWRRGSASSGAPAAMSDPVSFHALQTWQEAHPGQTSMLLLVESMGWPRAPALQDWLRGRLLTARMATRWTIHQSDEAFVGSTTSGELRALCGLRGHYSRVTEADARGCLPRGLAAHGVTSLGIHGFGLRMFDRNDWWPRVGLQPWQWPDSKDRVMPMNCNQAFPGVCDSAVIDQAVAQAQQPKRFVYALTLDTHLPMNLRHEPELPADLRAACSTSSTPIEACQLVRKLGDLLGRIEASLAKSVATPFVLVAGDHAPPFGERANRESFLANRVPIFILTPVAAP